MLCNFHCRNKLTTFNGFFNVCASSLIVKSVEFNIYDFINDTNIFIIYDIKIIFSVGLLQANVSIFLTRLLCIANYDWK